MQYIRYIYISITVYKSLSRRKSLHVSGDNRETVVHFINNSYGYTNPDPCELLFADLSSHPYTHGSPFVPPSSSLIQPGLLTCVLLYKT